MRPLLLAALFVATAACHRVVFEPDEYMRAHGSDWIEPYRVPAGLVGISRPRLNSGMGIPIVSHYDVVDHVVIDHATYCRDVRVFMIEDTVRAFVWHEHGWELRDRADECPANQRIEVTMRNGLIVSAE